MISDILNQHQNVVIESEMHAKTIEAYFNFLDQVQENFDHYSDRKGFRLDEHWLNNRRSLHHMFFASAGKQPAKNTADKEVRYHGLKTPGYERYFEHFEDMFAPVKPLYVYAIRNVGSVWRSWATREFNASFDEFDRRYQRSLRQAMIISTKASKRFALFNLDEYIAADKSRTSSIKP